MVGIFCHVLLKDYYSNISSRPEEFHPKSNIEPDLWFSHHIWLLLFTIQLKLWLKCFCLKSLWYNRILQFLSRQNSSNITYFPPFPLLELHQWYGMFRPCARLWYFPSYCCAYNLKFLIGILTIDSPVPNKILYQAHAT